jgi:hypothetical protein
LTDENAPEQNTHAETAHAETAPSERDQWIDAVARLIELTQNGELQWRVGGRTTPGLGEPTTPPYFADYKKHRYKLEERWVKAPPPTYAEEMFRSFRLRRNPPKDRFIVTLDLVDGHGRSLYSVPYVTPLWDLLSIVQKQTAAADALHDLLG